MPVLGMKRFTLNQYLSHISDDMWFKIILSLHCIDKPGEEALFLVMDNLSNVHYPNSYNPFSIGSITIYVPH